MPISENFSQTNFGAFSHSQNELYVDRDNFVRVRVRRPGDQMPAANTSLRAISKLFTETMQPKEGRSLVPSFDPNNETFLRNVDHVNDKIQKWNDKVTGGKILWTILNVICFWQLKVNKIPVEEFTRKYMDDHGLASDVTRPFTQDHQTIVHETQRDPQRSGYVTHRPGGGVSLAITRGTVSAADLVLAHVPPADPHHLREYFGSLSDRYRGSRDNILIQHTYSMTLAEFRELEFLPVNYLNYQYPPREDMDPNGQIIVVASLQISSEGGLDASVVYDPGRKEGERTLLSTRFPLYPERRYREMAYFVCSPDSILLTMSDETWRNIACANDTAQRLQRIDYAVTERMRLESASRYTAILAFSPDLGRGENLLVETPVTMQA